MGVGFGILRTSGSGGGGGGTTITTVANYSALPLATAVSGKFYWCEASQGTKWLPFSVGGTYYPLGMYYSNGVTWEYSETPYQATLAEVNTGTNTDKFVSPYTFTNADKWSNYTLKTTTISTTSPLQGGGDLSANRTFSITQANATTNGYLSSADWTTFNSKGNGTVTSVGLTMPTAFTVTNSPIISSGSIAVTGSGTTAQYIRGDGTLATFPTLTGYVPYVGATTDVDLGTFNLTADHIILNTNPSDGGFVVGSTQWNNTDGTPQTLLKGGNVILKNGVDLVARIVNKTGIDLLEANYPVVQVSGAVGGRLSVTLAQANNDANSVDTLGIITENINNNLEGFILTVGQLLEINTTGSLQSETWVDGDVLYLSPTVAGAITNIKPTGLTGHLVVLGYVEYAHAIHGKIYVKIMNGWELDELHNVYINTPINNNILSYVTPANLWENRTLGQIIGGVDTQYVRGDGSLATFPSSSGVTSVSALTLGTTGTDLSSTVANGTTTPVITLNVPTASATNRGALSSADWTIFNNKQDAVTLGNLTNAGSDGISITGGTNAVNGAGADISQQVSNTTQNGYLSSTDWNTFKGKQNALTIGDLTDVGTDGITITGGTGAIIGSGVDISQQVANATQNGYLSSTDWNTFNSAAPSFIPALPVTSYPQGYYANNGSATLSIMGNVSTAALSGTASLNSIAGTNTLTRTVRITIPTSSTAGSKAGVRTAALRHTVGQGFMFSVCWAIQDAAYVAGAKQFHGLLPISTLSTISNLVNVESLINFVGIGSDASDLNLQIFHSSTGVTTKIDLGSDFPANRTAGAVMNNVYVFEMYNEPNTLTVKYRITERSTGVTAQGTITDNLPDITVLLGSQAIRTNGASTLATVTQWSYLIGYII